MHSQKIIANYQFFHNIPIFVDLFLQVPCNTSENREQNSKKIIWLQFFMFIKLVLQIFV